MNHHLHNWTFKEEMYSEDSYVNRDGEVIENIDERGFVVHKITCFIDGEEAGYIKISYIEKKRWDRNIQNNPLIFRKVCNGHCDIPNRLLNASIDDIVEYFSKNYYGRGSGYVESIIESAETLMGWWNHYYVDKPIVDFIKTNEGFERKGVATLLHIYAIKFSRERLGLKLFKSTCLVPGNGPSFYNSKKTLRTLPLKKVKAKDKRGRKIHSLNVDREYFIYTKNMEHSMLNEYFGVEK